MELVVEGSEDYKILNKNAESVPDVVFGNQEFITYSEKMFDIMFKNNGIGLAAPQVGDSFRMFITNTSQTKRVCINPIVEKVSQETSVYKEGCLSFPNLRLSIKRPQSILVSYYDLDGKRISEEMNGIDARCFLHEFDHINGKVFIDYAGPAKLKLAREKARKILKKKKA